MSLRSALLDAEEAAALEVRGSIEAAVLVGLFERDGELHTIFTERRHDLRRHGGEISFPGGRREPSDAGLLATALRETREEIGLEPAAVEVIGALQPTPTLATGYAVYPFVALIAPDVRWTASDGEVAGVLELPLSAIRAGSARRRLTPRGTPIRTDTYLVDEHLIWGATARILSDLLDRVAPASRCCEAGGQRATG